jgi:hypothetical protein
MSGCAVCVYDLYLSSLEDYKHDLITTQTQLRDRSVPVSEWPDEIRQANVTSQNNQPLDDLGLDPSMKAFLLLEKKLGQNKS